MCQWCFLVSSVLGVELGPAVEPVVASGEGAYVVDLLEVGEEGVGELGCGEEGAAGGGHVVNANLALGHGEAEIGRGALLVAALGEEEGVREGLFALVVGLGGVVVECVHGGLVAVGAEEAHVGEPDVLEFEGAGGGLSLGVALLRVEDEADGPTDGYGVEARETA